MNDPSGGAASPSYANGGNSFTVNYLAAPCKWIKGVSECITEFQTDVPFGITAGPDGALWFTGMSGYIGRITTAGVNTGDWMNLSASSHPSGIAVGPDGALWFTEGGASEIGKIGRITTTSAITEFPIPTGISRPFGITAGPDGALWFTENAGNNIGRITTTGTITEFPIPTANSGPNFITAGPDGALWFTESSPNNTSNKIGRITTAGVITNEFLPPTFGSSVGGITAGPDGALWFTEWIGNNIGRITTTGTITEFPVPTANGKPLGITAGPDGALWFTEDGASKIGRITTTGTITEFPVPTANSHPFGITAGPDGALWFTEQAGNNIGRVIPPSPSPVNATHDFNGDGVSDFLWRDILGNIVVWISSHVPTPQGTATSATIAKPAAKSGSFGAVSNTYSIIGQRDFDGDGNADLLWRDTDGNLYLWFMKGLTLSSSAGIGHVSASWSIKGTGDFNGDGMSDVLWQNTAGNVAIWLMNGSQITSSVSLGTVPPSTTWNIVATDASGHIFWQDAAGDVAFWQVSGGQLASSTGIGNVPGNWQIVGVGDFNGDGNTDILFRDTNTGTVAIWFLNSAGQFQSGAGVAAVPTSTTWTIAETGDFNGDGMSDILWTDGTGNVALWFMNASTITSTIGLGNVGTSWQVQSLNAE